MEQNTRLKTNTASVLNAGGERQKVLWRFSDGRAGHDAQSQGLASALSDLIRCDSHDIQVPLPLSSYARGLFGLRPVIRALPRPDLLIGAGHAGHAPMLLAQYRHGGRTIVLMKPSLPIRFFDLCLIPEHDKICSANNVLTTVGPLNLLRPSAHLCSDQGLLLVGGNSKHFRWDEGGLQQQVLKILAQNNIRWTVTDSPRTPASTRAFLQSLNKDGVHYMPYDEKNSTALVERLQKAATVWVSEDSMSMLYEALSTGAAVGVLHVPSKHNSRLASVAQNLANKRLLTLFNDWRSGQVMAPPIKVLAEAARCANILIKQFGWEPAKTS